MPGEHEGELQYEGVFEYELAGVEYVDFTKTSFDEGVGRLSTHLGPPEEASRYNVNELVSPIVVKPGGDDGHDINWRTVGLIAGAVAAAAAIVWLAVALWPSSSGSEQDEAEDLVAGVADATTARDFEEAAAIDPSRTADELVTLYGYRTTPSEWFRWTHTSMTRRRRETSAPHGSGVRAVDYDPEPETRTHVICSDWLVDLEAGTATWESSSDEFFPDEEIPSEEFADTYAETCT